MENYERQFALASNYEQDMAIKLTKYNTLPNEQNFIPQIYISQNENQLVCPKLIDGRQVSNNNNGINNNISHFHNQFQVTWRNLSFHVNQSSYNRLINKTLKRASCLLKGTGNRSESTTDSETLPKPKSDEKRVIFENLNGYVKSGELSAILGPSGAGKTSLLNAICGSTSNGYRGSIKLVGKVKDRMRLSIIPQKDYLMEKLTVKENLLYSSKILNNDPKFDHDANIIRVVKMLNLTNCLHVSAGNISGGEYKRVSIAQELLHQPDILVLDEPTSGLDSLNCKRLIRSLVGLIEASRSGLMNPIAIVMTIHQPDVEIYSMFDHVYCLASRGRVIFDGRPSETIATIRSRAGFELDQLPDGLRTDSVNPANLLIEIASEALFGPQPIDKLAAYQRKQIEYYLQQLELTSSMDSSNNNKSTNVTHYNRNKLLNQPKKGNNATFDRSLSSSQSTWSTNSATSTVSQTNSQHQQLDRDKRLSAKKDHSGLFWHHTNLLARRTFVSTLRDPLMTLMSLVFHLAIPFVMWTVYPHHIGSVKSCPIIQRDMDMLSMATNTTMSRMAELQEELMTSIECSTMFFLTTYSYSMCGISVAALAFPLNMHILLKEVRNGWYNLPSYVLAKTIASFPFEVLFPAVSIAIVYILLGMPSSYMEWRLGAMALVMALISMLSHTQGLMFGALFMDSVQTAIFMATALSLPYTLLSGYTARIKQLPRLLQHLSFLSPYRYSSDLNNLIRFGFGLCPCNQQTDDYLRTKEPTFTDIPSNMKPLFTYYIVNTASNNPASSEPIETSNVTSTTNATDTIIFAPNNNNNNNYTETTTLMPIMDPFVDNTSTTSLMRQTLSQLIPGISQDMSLNGNERTELIAKIESNEVDLFSRMADMMSRSFSFGLKIDNCKSVRSQLLTAAGAPEDDYLPVLFGLMFALLVVWKIVLFLIVKYKIGSRV